MNVKARRRRRAELSGGPDYRRGLYHARVGLRRVYDNLKKPETASAFLESLALSCRGTGPGGVRGSAAVLRQDNQREKYVAFTVVPPRVSQKRTMP
jgi:hypothetical protein